MFDLSTWGRVGAVALFCASVLKCTGTEERRESSAPAVSAGFRLENGSFDGGLAPWWGTGNIAGSMTVQSGALCADIPGGLANPWDAMIGQSDLPLEQGAGYELRFTAWASTDVDIVAQVGEPYSPWTRFAMVEASLGAAPETFVMPFKMGATSSGRLCQSRPAARRGSRLGRPNALLYIHRNRERSERELHLSARRSSE